MNSNTFDLESYQPLPITYQLRHSILKKIQLGEDPLPDIQGREDVKDDVLRALLSGAHPYLVSEEGTGKTRLARSLTKLLPPIPAIKGCSYHDDPKWPIDFLCPRCRTSADPVKEFGVEMIPGERRFSRIQGNEYTNEAKLLGLKDIQAIAQGKSPADPLVFSGTGIFRANRGLLFVDELPAIRTKVQVILHPVLEEKRAILEEYHWEHPLDLVLVATGNPQGFAHVNEVSRPLLDRLELIYMHLPDSEVERDIILKERFRITEGHFQAMNQPDIPSYPSMAELERRTMAPWWIIDLVNGAARHSRSCRWLDKKASIRGTTRALDHTYASAELEKRDVTNISDAYSGLKLALRGRLGLRADLMDFDNPWESFRRTDQVVEDLLCNAFTDLAFQFEADGERLGQDITSLLSDGIDNITSKLSEYDELASVVGQMIRAGRDRINNDLSETEKELYLRPEDLDAVSLEQLNISALETVVNIGVHRKIIDESIGEKIFIPKLIKW
ncbi:MAG: AAA family ATPase [Chloroflexota bacterium]|nr:AAA family ATPase [Chloroflexota bacterium]